MILQVTRLAASRRGARRRREWQDGAGPAAGQGAVAGRRNATPSGWPCSATRSGWPSTSSGRSPVAAQASAGVRRAPTRSSVGSGERQRATARTASSGRRPAAEMARLARELPDGKRYDSVVVDEAQDFAETWWDAVIGASATR